MSEHPAYDHAAMAERILSNIEEWYNSMSEQKITRLLAQAQVHATLALLYNSPTYPAGTR